MEPDLLPSEKEEPAEYDSCGTYELPDDRECDVNDICQFIVNYINSDVLVSTLKTKKFKAYSTRRDCSPIAY